MTSAIPTAAQFLKAVAENTDGAEMVFMMGLPASGKSTHRDIRNDLTAHVVIDPDEVKERHPGYDPKNPRPLHAWSKEITDAMFAQALSQGAGQFIIDGTGTNGDKMVRRIRQAARAGFATRVIFVRCTLETSLKRNAARARNVPEDVVREKADLITTSFEIVEALSGADVFEIVDND